MRKYDAILPAGGRIDGEFAAKVRTSSKALIEIDGETVLARTLRALKDSGLVNRTVVIGPEGVRDHSAAAQADITIAERESGPSNIFAGLEALLATDDKPEKVLIVTTDLPFLTPELLRTFIGDCPADRDICVPLVSKQQYNERFPGTGATFVALRDDVWTTGCAFMLDVAAMQRARPHIERVFENRKSKIGLARLLGPAFVFKWLTKRLSLEDVENKIQSLLGSSGKAVTNSPPELAYDIDYLEDYEYALTHLAEGPRN